MGRECQIARGTTRVRGALPWLRVVVIDVRVGEMRAAGCTFWRGDRGTIGAIAYAATNRALSNPFKTPVVRLVPLATF